MYHASLRGLLAGCALLALTAESAQAQTLRFSDTRPGRVIAVGNTLGLSKAVNQNGPGTSDAIGTFLSLGNTVDDMPPNPLNPWPPGTTYDWQQNGSTAQTAAWHVGSSQPRPPLGKQQLLFAHPGPAQATKVQTQVSTERVAGMFSSPCVL